MRQKNPIGRRLKGGNKIKALPQHHDDDYPVIGVNKHPGKYNALQRQDSRSSGIPQRSFVVVIERYRRMGNVSIIRKSQHHNSPVK